MPKTKEVAQKPVTVRLILGDQLSGEHSWFKSVTPNVVYVLMEMRQETDYCSHHIQKIIGFFLAMRNFADELTAAGHSVRYLRLDAELNQQSLTKNLASVFSAVGAARFEYLYPDEYRLDQQLKKFCGKLKIQSEAFETEHFFTGRNELKELFEGKKTYRMENFYRHMRRKHDILMEGDEPMGGEWNFDSENRRALPKNHKVPAPCEFSRDVSEIVKLLKKAGVKTIGTVKENNFIWPVTRAESLKLLSYFCKHQLSQFGTYQDALSVEHRDLFHSRLSFALNTKMISPREVIAAVVASWQRNQSQISLPQVEGFVRQILGWREFMRGVYWAQMPSYESLNYFGHSAALPNYFWTGKTKMRCVAAAVGQSLDWAYAHHIQRLMVTGNFALLAGINPDEVDAWYLGIYIDAVQWVEITNVRGMSQFADGGIVGSKPYVSSANYINKMSNYCAGCWYDREKRHGERACPFNSLYWDFHARHRDKLAKNPRIGHAFRILDNMPAEEQQKTLAQAREYLSKIEEL